jgi:hypothetical protein
MTGLLRRLLRRRRPMVLVDEAAWRSLCAAAALADAEEIVLAAELRWLDLDPEEKPCPPGS